MLGSFSSSPGPHPTMGGNTAQYAQHHYDAEPINPFDFVPAKDVQIILAIFWLGAKILPRLFRGGGSQTEVPVSQPA